MAPSSPKNGGPGDRPDPPRQRQQADAGGGRERHPFGRDGGQYPKGGGPVGGANPDHYPSTSPVGPTPLPAQGCWWPTRGTIVTPCASGAGAGASILASQTDEGKGLEEAPSPTCPAIATGGSWRGPSLGSTTSGGCWCDMSAWSTSTTALS